MDSVSLSAALRDVPLGGLRFLKTIGSTNDEAHSWAAGGAPDLSLVIADEQTAGRGRLGRKWSTPAGTALAFSLILRPTPAERIHPARVTGLGALALTDSLQTMGLKPQIKWPNDVLLNERKFAGVLVESIWSGPTLEAFILGIGANVSPGSVPPASKVQFPATSIESEGGRGVDRVALLQGILRETLNWRSRLGTDEFIEKWGESLAFRGRQVQVWRTEETLITGEVAGLEADGSLVIRTRDGARRPVQFGEIHLRPA